MDIGIEGELVVRYRYRSTVIYIGLWSATETSCSVTSGKLKSGHAMSSTDNNDELSGIRIKIPRRYYLLPGAAVLTGISIGLFRGSRTASLRFLAENAHRPPRTVRGWYLYNKTKNYRVLLGGLKEAGADATKLGLAAAAWVALEGGCTHLGLDDIREVAAGLGTGTLLGVVCMYSFTPLLFRRAHELGGCRQIVLDSRPAHYNFGGPDRRSAPGAAVEQGIFAGTGADTSSREPSCPRLGAGRGCG